MKERRKSIAKKEREKVIELSSDSSENSECLFHEMRKLSPEMLLEYQRKEMKELMEKKAANIQGIKRSRMPEASSVTKVIKDHSTLSPESVKPTRQEWSVRMADSNTEAVQDEIPVETEPASTAEIEKGSVSVDRPTQDAVTESEKSTLGTQAVLKTLKATLEVQAVLQMLSEDERRKGLRKWTVEEEDVDEIMRNEDEEAEKGEDERRDGDESGNGGKSGQNGTGGDDDDDANKDGDDGDAYDDGNDSDDNNNDKKGDEGDKNSKKSNDYANEDKDGSGDEAESDKEEKKSLKGTIKGGRVDDRTRQLERSRIKAKKYMGETTPPRWGNMSDLLEFAMKEANQALQENEEKEMFQCWGICCKHSGIH